MTRRLPSKPGPGRDFRALAGGPDLPERAHDRRPDDVTIRVRTRPDGTRCALVIASVVLERPADVRELARRLGAAAEALEGSPS